MKRAIATERSGNEEVCPVSDSFLASLYRATPAEARDLCLPLPEPVRASLALYCAARVHLRELARVIAATCAQSSLMREGRESGRVLWEESTRRRPDPPEFRQLRKGVTLAIFRPLGPTPRFFDIDLVEADVPPMEMPIGAVSEADL